MQLATAQAQLSGPLELGQGHRVGEENQEEVGTGPGAGIGYSRWRRRAWTALPQWPQLLALSARVIKLGVAPLHLLTAGIGQPPLELSRAAC